MPNFPQGDKIEEKGILALAESLKSNKTVTRLRLKGVNIGDSGTIALAEVLKLNSTLRELNLDGNQVGEAGVQAIADALKINNSLNELDLKGNEIGHSGVRSIADALKINKTLTLLNLSENEIYESGARLIADALKINTTLTGLNLSDNSLGSLGTQIIVDVLKVEQISFPKDKSNMDIKDIEGALKIGKGLLRLNLSLNKIQNRGLSAIVEMLKVNNSLQILDISDNWFYNISELAEPVKCNKSLTELNIDERSFLSLADDVEKALEFNICLISVTESPIISALLKRNKEIQTNLSKRIFECKNAHLSLLDYKIFERLNVAVIFKNVWKLEQFQKYGRSYEECLREYWELISLNAFSKYFLFILGVCKLNQIPPSRSHLLGIPKDVLAHIGSFLNPRDFSIPNSRFVSVLKKQKIK